MLAALVAGVVMASVAPTASAAPPSPTPNPPPTITEFPIPGGADPGQALGNLTLGPDGNIWFVARDKPLIGRILSHAPYTVTEFPVPTDDSYVSDIITGPDGNLWFTEQGDFRNEGARQAGKIGRILPHAPFTITEFTTADPQNRPRPFQIVTGPDRNLYFTEVCTSGAAGVASCPPNAGGSVGRITPFGSDARIQASVTQVAHTAPCAPVICNSLSDITVGPDRNLWLTDNTNIDRLTVPGYQLAQFPVPNGAHPPFITTGLDGNLWFTGGGGTSGNQFGRISPRDPHTITLYPASATNPAPNTQGITTGPDGRLWFAEYTNSAVGTFSPFAPTRVTEYQLPVSGANPRNAISGPCNTLWFSDQAGYIGRTQLPNHDGLPGLLGSGLSDVIGNDLASDLQPLRGGPGSDTCLAPPPGIFSNGQ